MVIIGQIDTLNLYLPIIGFFFTPFPNKILEKKTLTKKTHLQNPTDPSKLDSNHEKKR